MVFCCFCFSCVNSFVRIFFSRYQFPANESRASVGRRTCVFSDFLRRRQNGHVTNSWGRCLLEKCRQSPKLMTAEDKRQLETACFIDEQLSSAASHLHATTASKFIAYARQTNTSLRSVCDKNTHTSTHIHLVYFRSNCSIPLPIMIHACSGIT